jgi:uncharacterized membrane protein
MIAKFLPGVGHLQNIHPLVVHFPIAFLTGMALVYVLAYVFRRDAWARTAFWLLVMGVVTAAAALATGLYAQDGVMVAASVRAHLLAAHKQWMLAAFALSVAAVIWAALTGGFPKKGRPLFIVLCLSVVAVLVKGADYGGRMVYDYNAGGNACGQPIEFTQ